MSFILSNLPRNSKVELVKDKLGVSLRVYWVNSNGKRNARVLLPSKENLEDPWFLGAAVEDMFFDMQEEDEVC